MRGLAIRLGIIAAIAGGAWVLRPFISGDAGSLAVGDCFDEPATRAETVEEVQHHPCTEVHDGEVFYVGNYEPATTTYPSDPDFFNFISDRCTGAFSAYTGLDINTTQNYDFSAFTPTVDGWGKGGRKVTCYAVKVDGTKFNASIKKAS
jgi:putative regulator of septum formation